MLDIGFWELVIIGVVGLTVLGPDRLPSAIRSVTSVIHNVRQTANNLKAELNHELKVNELQQQLSEAKCKEALGLNEDKRNSHDQESTDLNNSEHVKASGSTQSAGKL
ncbi:Sec-independent protein translocase protein TatB [Catenovulum agarivorans]|uniref:Sec-independent protein translocase protein TatB n=1 Tax=Catenovulum agarivorans TaxID=1172192 RepID=UPI0002FEE81A|nr:Sec-independent protein translocase protein TatB [Catenovulum agarivorans]